MTDELDPKLREFEAKLRRLKPYSADGRRQTADGRRQFVGGRRRKFVVVCVAAAIVLLVICLIPVLLPPSNPPSAVSSADYRLPSAVSSADCHLPSQSLRQQLVQLLDEMNVANPIAETKPEYPVVEIVVCDSPIQETRRQTADGRRREISFRQTSFDDFLLPPAAGRLPSNLHLTTKEPLL